jgi:hypothetical protein
MSSGRRRRQFRFFPSTRSDPKLAALADSALAFVARQQVVA